MELLEVNNIGTINTEWHSRDGLAKEFEKEDYVGKQVTLNSMDNAIHDNDLETVQLWLDSIKDSQPELINESNENGKTALHFAAQYNNLHIANLLLLAGADPCLIDEDGKLPLHIACSLPEDNDVTELVKALLKSKSPIGTLDEDLVAKTPLHYAAKNGHVQVVNLLLDGGAELSVKDGVDDTPIHVAVFNEHAVIVKEFIRREPLCVTFCGKDEQTPLHKAVQTENYELVQIMVESKSDMNAITDDGETPLDLVAFSGSKRIAQLLVEKGALVNPPQPTDLTNYRTPFERAVYFGKSDLVSYFLENGAKVTSRALQDAISEGYEGIASVIIQSPQWPVALRSTFRNGTDGRMTTPFRELIRRMPDLAEDVLNKCTVEDPGVKQRGDINYNAVYNYEFIEDFSEKKKGTDGSSHESCVDSETFGCDHFDILQRDRDCVFTWGPVGFSKYNHPLAIMVQKKRLNLLNHPVVGSLLHHKWKAFGQYGYFFNLSTYCFFLVFLTAFALVIPHPQDNVMCAERRNETFLTDQNSKICGINLSEIYFLYFAAAVVILFAVCRLLVETVQFISLRMSYLTDWVNWMEVTLFVFSIIFVLVYTVECYCGLDWQWQIGVVAVFLGWIDLIIFISKFPLTGIYVLMLVKILYTFLKMVVLTLLLVIAFGIAFYMVFYDPRANRSPFANPFQSLLKTMTMTTGELDFNDIFRFDPTGPSEVESDIGYPAISTILWILFIILMPILLTNMLVGLAVGDVDSIKKEAELQKLALQVDQVLTVEEILPQKVRRRFRTTFIKVEPNRKNSTKVAYFISKIGFYVWGGERYDSRESINRALRPSLNDGQEIAQQIDLLARDVEEIKRAHYPDVVSSESVSLKTKTGSMVNEVERDLSILKQDINEIKKDLHYHQELKYLIEEIAKKHEISVPSGDARSLEGIW